MSAPGSIGMRADEYTIADAVPSGYQTAVVGKWHLAGNTPLGSLTGGWDHAPRCGFDLHVGSLGNLGSNFSPFLNYNVVITQLIDLAAAQIVSIQNYYATTKTTDDALKVIERFGDGPWLLWVAYNAVHKPYHIPPQSLLQSSNHDFSTDLGRGKAMVEALDSEIGRLLAGIRPDVLARTTVIYFGDNGTKEDLVQPPFDPEHDKGTVYQGGVNVPFIVRSRRTPPQYRGTECDALIDLCDLLPTVATLLSTGVPQGTDGVSLLPYLVDPTTPSQRPWVYAEAFSPNFMAQPGVTISQVALDSHAQAARESRYKLIRKRTFMNGQVSTEVLEFYDLENDEFEANDLLDTLGNPPVAQQATFDALLQVILLQSS